MRSSRAVATDGCIAWIREYVLQSRRSTGQPHPCGITTSERSTPSSHLRLRLAGRIVHQLVQPVKVAVILRSSGITDCRVKPVCMALLSVGRVNTGAQKDQVISHCLNTLQLASFATLLRLFPTTILRTNRLAQIDDGLLTYYVDATNNVAYSFTSRASHDTESRLHASCFTGCSLPLAWGMRFISTVKFT